MRPQGRHEAGGRGGGVVEHASLAMYRRPRRQVLLLAMLCRLLCPHLQAGPSCPTLFTVSEPSVPRSWPFSEPIPRGIWSRVDSVPVPARPLPAGPFQAPQQGRVTSATLWAVLEAHCGVGG